MNYHFYLIMNAFKNHLVYAQRSQDRDLHGVCVRIGLGMVERHVLNYKENTSLSCSLCKIP